ncbi:MAG: tRNA ligase [Deltaproteobacteria bacterium]|nr:tRNA ligase [Deltaproteobacteria bacterium]
MNGKRFFIDRAVLALGVRGAFAIVTGVENRRYLPEFERYRSELTERLRRELTEEAVASDPVLKGFRELHDRVGRSNRRFPSSAEALAGLFLRRGLIPSIQPVVDVYNCVCLETRLSLGAHDLEKIEGDVTLRLTDGTERFVPMGRTEPEPIGPGEYCYIDGSGEVLCRLEVRQAEKTKVTEETVGCFYLVQGNGSTSRSQVENALRRVLELTQSFCGGRVEHSGVLGE